MSHKGLSTQGLRPARLAHIRGRGLLQIDLEPDRDRADSLIYTLRASGGIFACETSPNGQELEALVGRELAFFGYGQSELGLYTLTADVRLADRRDFPVVSLRVMRIHEVRLLEEEMLAKAS